MKSNKLHSFRFSTPQQWRACRIALADLDSLDRVSGIRPLAPYGRAGALLATGPAHAPAVTPAGEIVWCDNHGSFHRLASSETNFLTYPAPGELTTANRIVSNPSGFWTIDRGRSHVYRFNTDTLTRSLSIDLASVSVVDIADAHHGQLVVLVEHEGISQAICLDRAGQIKSSVEFQGIFEPRAFVFLKRLQKFVVLAGEQHARLYWFNESGGRALTSLAVAGLRPCFRADTLGSDSDSRVFLAGCEGNSPEAPSLVLVLDDESNQLGEVPIDKPDAPTTGIAANRNGLYLTGPRGLVHHAFSDDVPEHHEPVHCQLITPSLFSPDREDQRRWLRIDVTSRLPAGTSLEIGWCATSDEQVRDQVEEVLTEASVPLYQRLRDLRDSSKFEQMVFNGVGNASHPQTFSAKLFDVRENYLWVTLTLTAAAGASLPEVSELSVVYPGRSLMEDLPAIYRRQESQPNNFVRSFVGVLETTTQELDKRIGALGSHIHPQSAPEPWLDFTARWLGVPWDDALALDQKRAIMTRAGELARFRGTRGGLEALLECLIPGAPRRFRVTDMTADYGLLVLGGGSRAGSRLPAIVGGYARCGTQLSRNTILDKTRLPCSAQPEDSTWQLVGNVRVEVAASADERKKWQAYLPSLINEMVPLTTRVDLLWVTASALRSNQLDGTLKLQSPPPPHLGIDAVTGETRLPEREARLSDIGPTIGTRLK